MSQCTALLRCELLCILGEAAGEVKHMHNFKCVSNKAKVSLMLANSVHVVLN